ncbi:hypothetical protein LVJ94_46360 [Pendulispora rubella]|uniref:Uncharacterized protein n=1 Tax=Pendulispora rubella TaxID=2741070 RepID=A0ABZ2L1V9_9BACT
MTMPLSRYISGDFVTPTMTFVWNQGIPYVMVGPQGPRELPKGIPFGGPDAPRHRHAMLPMLLDDLGMLPPPIATNLWDESSAADPTFHRVDPKSYDSLAAEAAAEPTRSIFRFLKPKALTARHLRATLFFPVEFEEPFDMPVIFERTAGSAGAALRELESCTWTEKSSSARQTLHDALSDALRLRLPMIVDY